MWQRKKEVKAQRKGVETKRKMTEIERVAQRGRRESQRALWEGTNPNNSIRIYIPARSWWNGPGTAGPRTQGRLVAIVEQWTHSSTIRFLSSFVFKLDLLFPPVVNGPYHSIDFSFTTGHWTMYAYTWHLTKHWRVKLMTRGNNEECRSRSRTRNMTKVGVTTEILFKSDRKEMDRSRQGTSRVYTLELSGPGPHQRWSSIFYRGKKSQLRG